MQPWFGEFQFAYGCTRELEDGDVYFPGWGMPTIPTQVKEKELGYDVAFFGAPVAPVFLQYKVSDHLTRPSGLEWHLFRRDYFRFAVYPRSKSPQHNRLIDLAHKGNEVYYCAPLFSTAADYASFHASRSVSGHSVFIPCANLPKNSSCTRHHIVYASGSRSGYFRSGDGYDFVVVPGRDELVASIRQYADKFSPPKEAIRKVTESLGVLFPPLPRGEGDHQNVSRGVAIISEFAIAMFGLALGFIRQTPLDWPEFSKTSE